jgi:hypothetical protein
MASFLALVGAAVVSGCAVDAQSPEPETSPAPADTAEAPPAKPAERVQIAHREELAPVIDREGKEVLPITKEEAIRLVGGDASKINVVQPKGPKVEGQVYYHCNAWMYPGDSVFCGSVFFGYTSILVENCTYYQWAIIFDGSNGYYYAVPPAQNGLCSYLDFGGWLWGANIGFSNPGPIPVLVTH